MAAERKPAGDEGPKAAAACPPGTVTIRCRLDGPLVVELPDGGAQGQPPGAIRLRVTDHLGGEFTLPTHKRAVALCRCGGTKSRPFCDGSHRTAGFSAADVAPGASPPSADP